MDPNQDEINTKFKADLSVVRENDREYQQIEDEEYKSSYSNRSSQAWVYALKDKLNDHSNLIDYFISYRIENLDGLLRMYERDGDELLQAILDRQDSFFKHSTGKYTIDLAAGKDCDNMYFNNLIMEVMDRVPATTVKNINHKKLERLNLLQLEFISILIIKFYLEI